MTSNEPTNESDELSEEDNENAEGRKKDGEEGAIFTVYFVATRLQMPYRVQRPEKPKNWVYSRTA